ncbi:MAG: hypothetical protein AAB572_01225 [Patescibacteria group bacterium]
MPASEKIAKILRADKGFLAKIERHLSVLTGKDGTMEKIVAENESLINDRLLKLGVAKDAQAKEVYDALISKIEADDHLIFEALGRPSFCVQGDCTRILEIMKKVAGTNHGFFLRRGKAIEFLKNEPPKKVMEYLGYGTVDEMLEKEDLFEIYSALRFVEGSEWLNGIFFKQYESLTSADFEEREIVVQALSEKWGKAASAFVVKKKHNISHLKEMGVVFVIPVALGISGELLRMISLIFHYLHEIPFYSELFKKNAEFPEIFSENIISLLRGDVPDRRLQEGEKTLWLVIQRYLAKDDENDWRLFAPHVNPEAIHWTKAGHDVLRLGEALDGRSVDLSFWAGLDWVGDYFKDEVGNDTLVSFNLVDTVMSLVKEKEMVKYLYHHEEALWNRVFSEYFSFEELEKFAKEYLLQGYFEI